MDAEPASSLQPADEQVGALDPGQNGCRIRALEYGVAEFGCESAQNRGSLKERATLVVERSENLLAQVLDHKALVCTEPGHGLAGVLLVP